MNAGGRVKVGGWLGGWVGERVRGFLGKVGGVGRKKRGGREREREGRSRQGGTALAVGLLHWGVR